MGQKSDARASVTCAVVAQKGGVGKTTTLLGIAGAAWERGLKVLVVDLDPQANATAALDPAKVHYTTNDVLADARPGIAATRNFVVSLESSANDISRSPFWRFQQDVPDTARHVSTR